MKTTSDPQIERSYANWREAQEQCLEVIGELVSIGSFKQATELLQRMSNGVASMTETFRRYAETQR